MVEAKHILDAEDVEDIPSTLPKDTVQHAVSADQKE